MEGSMVDKGVRNHRLYSSDNLSVRQADMASRKRNTLLRVTPPTDTGPSTFGKAQEKKQRHTVHTDKIGEGCTDRIALLEEYLGLLDGEKINEGTGILP
jgi:hypothetical protein